MGRKKKKIEDSAEVSAQVDEVEGEAGSCEDFAPSEPSTSEAKAEAKELKSSGEVPGKYLKFQKKGDK